jgi:hypothetical protein
MFLQTAAVTGAVSSGSPCTSNDAGTLTNRTGSDISPRINAAASFKPAIRSRPTLERFGALLRRPELRDDLADLLLVIIAQIIFELWGRQSPAILMATGSTTGACSGGVMTAACRPPTARREFHRLESLAISWDTPKRKASAAKKADYPHHRQAPRSRC